MEMMVMVVMMMMMMTMTTMMMMMMMMMIDYVTIHINIYVVIISNHFDLTENRSKQCMGGCSPEWFWSSRLLTWFKLRCIHHECDLNSSKKHYYQQEPPHVTTIIGRKTSTHHPTITGRTGTGAGSQQARRAQGRGRFGSSLDQYPGQRPKSLVHSSKRGRFTNKYGGSMWKLSRNEAELMLMGCTNWFGIVLYLKWILFIDSWLIHDRRPQPSRSFFAGGDEWPVVISKSGCPLGPGGVVCLPSLGRAE